MADREYPSEDRVVYWVLVESTRTDAPALGPYHGTFTRDDLSNVSGLGRGNAYREMPPLLGGRCEHVASCDPGESTRK